MAFITYRVSTSPTVPTVTTAKGLQLLNTEVDGNFKSLDVSKLETNGSAASLTAIPMGSAAGILAVANGGTGSSTASTGTGGVVLSNSPTLVAPSLGVPAFIDLTNARYLPLDGAISVTGKLPIAFGGTNALATPTAGAVPYGTGTAYAFTGVGTAGQVLTSAGAGIPTWTTVTTSAGGSNTQLQYNSSGSFAGSANMTFNGTTLSIASGLVGSNANFTDFPNARFVSSQANTGDSHIYNAGVAGEGVATDIAGGGQWGVGVYGVGATTGSTRGIGIVGDGAVSSSSDSAASIGVRGYATNTHSGGQNIGLYAQATGGGTNFALFMASGNIYSAVAQTWSLSDNETSALSFDTTGKAGVLKIITTDAAEGVTMSGTLGVTGTTLHTGKVTTLGQVQTPDVTSLLTTANTYPTTRPSLNLDFANSATLDPRITFTRGTNATYTGSDGLVKNTAGIHSPRFDWDPVTRECKGLLIEEARTNLLTYSSTIMSNNGWGALGNSLGSFFDVSTSTIPAPDGTLSAGKFVSTAITSQGLFLRGFSTIPIATYTASVYVYVPTQSGITNWSMLWDIGDNESVQSSTQTLFDTWVRVSGTVVVAVQRTFLDFNIRYNGTSAPSTAGFVLHVWGAQLEAGAFATSYIPSSVTWTGRASTATYVGSNGLIQTAASGVARYQYNPTNLSVAPFLLLEPAATNLVTYSEQFDNAAWVKARCSITANATSAPDGTMTADKLVEDTTVTNTHLTEYVISVVTGTNYTYSVYVKAAERTRVLVQMYIGFSAGVVVNLSTGTVTNSGAPVSVNAINTGNNWWRISVSAVSTTTGNGYFDIYTDNGTVQTYTGDGTSGVYIWGAQVETGSVATSYIPTVASQVTRIADTSTSAQTTRSADVATMTNSNFSSWYNQTEGTLLAEADTNQGTNSYPLGVWGGNATNRIAMNWVSLNRFFAGTRYAGTFSGNNTDTDTAPIGLLTKVAFAYAVGNNGCSINSGLTTTSAPVALPTGVRLDIGNNNQSTGNYLNGHIKRLTYYPTRLSNSTLQALTT